MIGKLIVGAVVVGAAYVGYKLYQANKAPSTPTSTTPSAFLPQTQSQAPFVAQRYVAAYGNQPAYIDQGFSGSCMGCMGAARVQIL